MTCRCGPVARRQRQRMAEVLEHGFLLVLSQGASELLLAVGDLGPDVLGQLADDVLPARRGQRETDVLQVALISGVISLVLEDAGDGGVEPAPFGVQLAHDAVAGRGEAVEALVALVLLAPLAGQEALATRAGAGADTASLRRPAGRARRAPCAGCSRSARARSWPSTARTRPPRRSSRRRFSNRAVSAAFGASGAVGTVHLR